MHLQVSGRMRGCHGVVPTCRCVSEGRREENVVGLLVRDSCKPGVSWPESLPLGHLQGWQQSHTRPRLMGCR